MAGLSDFDIDVTGQAALRSLKDGFAPLSAFSTGHSVDPNDYYDGVNVPVIPAFAGGTSTRANNGAYTPTTHAPNAVNVALTENKYIALQLDERSKGRASRVKYDEEMGVEIGYRLAEAAMTTIFADFTVANIASNVFSGAASTMDVDVLADIRNTLRTAWGSVSAMNLVLSTKFEQALNKDGVIVNNGSVVSAATGSLIEGQPGSRLRGLNIWFPDFLPANGEQLGGIATAPGAYVVATGYSMPDEPEKVNFQVFTDEATGLTLTYRRDYLANSGNAVKLDIWEYHIGTKIIDATRMRRLVDTSI